MRQIKDGAGRDRRQPGRRRDAAPSCFARAVSALILLSLVAGPLAAQERTGSRKGKTRTGEAKAPLLLLTETEVDLGELPKGSSAEARFELRNAGNADLRILDVRTGCACANATYDEVIPPGEVGYLTATLLTETLNGSVGQGISVMTNDPTSPSTFLLVRAEVVFAVRVLPEERIVLNAAARDRPVSRVIRRATDSGHGFFNLAGLEASVPWIDARAHRVREPSPVGEDLPAVEPGDWVLELRLDGQPPYGNRREVVEFKTGLDRQPLVKLDVYTELLAPVQLPVDRLFLQPREDGAGETLAFTVREELDPSVLRIEALPKTLQVDLEPGGGQAMKAHVRWIGERLDDGKLIFRIADEQVEIPVLYVPRR